MRSNGDERVLLAHGAGPHLRGPGVTDESSIEALHRLKKANPKEAAIVRFTAAAATTNKHIRPVAPWFDEGDGWARRSRARSDATAQEGSAIANCLSLLVNWITRPSRRRSARLQALQEFERRRPHEIAEARARRG